MVMKTAAGRTMTGQIDFIGVTGEEGSEIYTGTRAVRGFRREGQCAYCRAQPVAGRYFIFDGDAEASIALQLSGTEM